MITRRRWFILAFILVAFISIPYIYAILVAGKNSVFIGFLFNLMDSNSYIAKMYEGWSGTWRFTLPYTAQPGQGGYIFLYYLFLGHLARWLGLPLLVIYHGARIINALLMLAALAKFFTVFLGNKKPGAWTALVWATFGSGLGWLALLFGFFTADTWVVEAFPFLSAFAIPHFSLSLAIILWILSLSNSPLRWRSIIFDFFATLFLSLISPFSVILLLVILGGEGVWNWLLYKKQYLKSKNWLRLAWIGLGGAPMLFYQFWLVNKDPILAGWNAQNQTPSPAFWDLLIAFSPALLLAIWGSWIVIKDNLHSNAVDPTIDWFSPNRRLVVWAVLGFSLLFIPFDLQRRFIIGLYIPLVGLAVLGLNQIKNTKRATLSRSLVLGLSLPTNLIILVILILSCTAHYSDLYISKDEADAIAWIRTNTLPNALILAAPDTGTLIPAMTGRRVIYGHIYETVNASQEKQTVEDYFSGQMSPQQIENLVVNRGVDIIFCGPQEQVLSGSNTCPAAADLKILFQQGSVTLFDAHSSTSP